MSNFLQHRAMHDDGPYGVAIHAGHNHASHTAHPQTAVTDRHVPCPYEDKVVSNGTTARMVLMFLRDFLDQLSMGAQVQQSYSCPMAKCHQAFSAPLQVIQHLLSCPEVSRGEFECDKCNQWHSFPTNEKDWAQWMGWRSQHSLHDSHIQRKRSLGSKMREFGEFALRKKDPLRNKQASGMEPQLKSNSMTGTRPDTATSEASGTTFMSGSCFQHAGVLGQQASGPVAALTNPEKPTLPHALPGVDGGVFWPGFNADMCDMPSTVSSIALSSTVNGSPSESLSQNTSQTTLFTPGLGPYGPSVASAHPSSTLPPQQYLFPTQPPFSVGVASSSTQPPSISAMSLDEPLSAVAPSMPPTEAHATASDQTWWSPKVEVETPQPTQPPPEQNFAMQGPMAGMLTRGLNSGVSSPASPCRDASPYFPVQQQVPTHPVQRSLSQESMQTGMATAYGTPVPGRSQAEAGAPNTGHNRNATADSQKDARVSTEELVCPECQWKPRGVRENLKGYLRKHKNTHKGLRLACDVAGCTKTFSRLDNLKKHKKDKHGIEEHGSLVPAKRVAGELKKAAEEAADEKGPGTGTLESELRIAQASQDYPMLWPALHF
ncbi:hypothetical protein VTK26DRAFT_246 [Humicola hyalothermophila]